MILRKWSKLTYDFYGKISFGCDKRKPINELKCDKCGLIWEESSKIEKRFDKWHGHFCAKCLKEKCKERLREAGTLALSKLTKEERIINARMGGTATQISPNRDIESFTYKRWANMSEEDRNKQVFGASSALKEKLKDPEYSKKHFEKILKNSKIGYISKGQRELHSILVDENMTNFVLDGIFLNMKVDIISHEKKLAIEYNGDYFHCNPRTWKPDDYNKTIKMTASDKWNADRNRRFMLYRNGYRVIVIWESDWKKNKNKCIDNIKQEYYETIKD
jgi:very-short-patch-repair endonuclease